MKWSGCSRRSNRSPRGPRGFQTDPLPEFAPRYVDILRGAEWVVSFMTVAEMRQGALDANRGPRKCAVLETYLADFSVLHTDSLLCSTWAAVRSESTRKGRQMSSADAWIAATALVYRRRW